MPKCKFPWAVNTTLWTEIKGRHSHGQETPELKVRTRKTVPISSNCRWQSSTVHEGHEKAPQEVVIVTDNLPLHMNWWRPWRRKKSHKWHLSVTIFHRTLKYRWSPGSSNCHWQSSTGHEAHEQQSQVASTVTPNLHRTQKSGRNGLHEAVIVTDNLPQDTKVPMKQQLSRATSTGQWGQEETVSMKRKLSLTIFHTLAWEERMKVW